MKTKETGVYKYCLESNNTQYSGFFQTKKEALIWYEKHGKWLEKQFDCKLVLKNELENRFIERQKNAIAKEKEREAKKRLKNKQ